MKILFLTRVPATVVAFVVPLARQLCNRGNTVEFAFGPGPGWEEVKALGFRWHMLTMQEMSRSTGNFRAIWQLRRVIEEGQYDVVHSYSPVIGLYGRIAATWARTPVVVHSVIGSLLAPGVPLSHRILYLTTETLTSRMVDLFITLNEADSKSLVRYRLASADRVVTLKYEYGVDLAKFDPASVDHDKLARRRCELGLADHVPVIGFVGRMVGSKGILDLYEAYRLLRSKGVKAKLLFLGDVLSTDNDAESAKILKDLVRSSDFAGDVVFLGFQWDVPFNVSLMDIVVHPSHHEGFPRIPVEAGAMGKPSVCTAVSGAEVAVEDGKTGFVVPIKNPEMLARAIERLITTPGLIREMGSTARQRVATLFDQKNIVAQQVSIYQDLFHRMGCTISL